MIKSVVIVGLGAIGSVYAVALHEAGVDLRVAADEARVRKYREQGREFNGKKYDFNYFTPSMGDVEADLVIIATKSSGLSEALDLIAPIVGQHTQILPLLNGITSEQICARRYSWERVVYGYFMGHTSTRQGNSVSQDGKYKTYFGDATNDPQTLSPRIKAICELFDHARIPYKVPEDMIAALWQKFIVNIGMNQATAVLQRTYGHLQNSPTAHAYMVSLMREASQVATALGISNSDAMVEKAVSMLTTLAPEDGSSTYQDVMSGRPTEVDLFADTVCRLGQEVGVATPYNQHAAIILRALI